MEVAGGMFGPRECHLRKRAVPQERRKRGHGLAAVEGRGHEKASGDPPAGASVADPRLLWWAGRTVVGVAPRGKPDRAMGA